MKNSPFSDTNLIAHEAIKIVQAYLNRKGYCPVIHFELEGCYQPPFQEELFSLNFNTLNQSLAKLNIDGMMIPEYWQHQWEFVSLFNGQSPLKEAYNLFHAMRVIPKLLALQGIKETYIKPVVWGGGNGKMAYQSRAIFSADSRDVHIPNAVQLNVSMTNASGENLIVKENFGEYLQQCFLISSLENSLLYLPEEEAYERLSLKKNYGLDNELSSPNDISGGHQGSIALYKEIGKHNQLMGEETLIVDKYNQPLVTKLNWQKTARIEHRLGASSLTYNPFVNVLYALINLTHALSAYEKKACASLLQTPPSKPLPHSLYDQANEQGAISLFEQSQWLNKSVNHIQKNLLLEFPDERISSNANIGDTLKAAILAQYQKSIVNLC